MSSRNSIHNLQPGSQLPTNVFSTPVNGVSGPGSVEDPFEAASRLGSTSVSSASALAAPQPRQRKFKSARLVGEYEKPWVGIKDPKMKYERMIFWGFILIGFLGGAAVCYFAYASVSNLDYCLILDDNFKDINEEVWNYEIQRGGFGSGSFEWTTRDPKNAYVDEQGLHIVPTLTVDSTDITLDQLLDEYVVNLTTAKTCTAKEGFIDNCSIRSNVTAGTIINPVRSARLNTRGKKTLRYGRVEVEAKMPKGNWLWPAIWMMPDKELYGKWPASGEIDIAESRGNHGDDYTDGRDSIISALHWGPLYVADAFWRTSGKHNVRRRDYTQKFHTYGLEWNEDYLFTYIDSRLLQVFFIKWKKGHKNMWERGNFGATIVNQSALHDPWSQTGRANTPFDEDFYLILNVAVGSTNGFFRDGVGNKPWGDGSLMAPKEFWMAKDRWYPTWGEGDTRGMTVKSVKMWSLGKCKNGLDSDL